MSARGIYTYDVWVRAQGWGMIGSQACLGLGCGIAKSGLQSFSEDAKSHAIVFLPLMRITLQHM